MQSAHLEIIYTAFIVEI